MTASAFFVIRYGDTELYPSGFHSRVIAAPGWAPSTMGVSTHSVVAPRPGQTAPCGST